MKAILEAKKKELLAQLEQSHNHLRQLKGGITQTESNINSLEGALQVIGELEREVELLSVETIAPKSKTEKK